MGVVAVPRRRLSTWACVRAGGRASLCMALAVAIPPPIRSSLTCLIVVASPTCRVAVVTDLPQSLTSTSTVVHLAADCAPAGREGR